MAFGLWLRFGYPRFSFISFSVDRGTALLKAQEAVRSRGFDSSHYSRAILFECDDWADRYLQKTLTMEAAEDFIRAQDYEVFYWKVRFFRELSKEEFIVWISPRTGEALSFKHLIDDIEPRAAIDKDEARRKAESFLKETYHLNFDEYEFHEEKIRRFDKRLDYWFSWEKKGVYVPWGREEGGAKLLVSATISGNEVREFYKHELDVPEKFERYIQNQFIFGEYLSSISFLLFIVLVGWSVALVVKKRSSVVVRFCKPWYIFLGLFLVFVNILYVVNNIHQALMQYPTSARFSSFIGLSVTQFLVDAIFLAVMLIMPGLAGEAVFRESFPDAQQHTFLHYLRSTFRSRGMAHAVGLGYLVFIIMLGMQATLFYYGQRYCGVWQEWLRMTQYSSAFLPFVSAFAVAASASFSEEISFRLFGISILKKYVKNTAAAILISAFIWGFGHSQYAIFPVWFRGIEVGIMGIMLGFLFVRYGLIPLIVAHYLFDAFWGVAAHICGRSTPLLWGGAVAVMALPLLIGIVAYAANKEEKERDIQSGMDRIQSYNLQVLTAFVASQKAAGMNAQTVRETLLSHNWDYDLVELAVSNVFGRV